MCDCPCHDNSPLSAEDLAELDKVGKQIRQAFRIDGDDPGDS